MWFAMSELTGQAIALPQMLMAKDQRRQRQMAWLADAPGATLVWLTLRIPGPIKTNARIEALFQQVVQQLQQQWDSKLIHQEMWRLSTGPEAAFLVTVEAKQLKQEMMLLEQKSGFYQLLDLDVIVPAADGVQSISRTIFELPPRPCLVCGGDAKSCSRSRRHGLATVQDVIASIIEKGELS